MLHPPGPVRGQREGQIVPDAALGEAEGLGRQRRGRGVRCTLASGRILPDLAMAPVAVSVPVAVPAVLPLERGHQTPPSAAVPREARLRPLGGVRGG